MGLDSFLEATVNEEFVPKTFKGSTQSAKKHLSVEDGSRADALLGDAVLLVGAVAEQAGVMGSTEMQMLRSMLDKRQLRRKPFYQKIKELVRDVTQLLERGEFLKSFLAHSATLAKWKHTSPDVLVAEVARMAAVLSGAFAHLQDVVCKVRFGSFPLAFSSRLSKGVSGAGASACDATLSTAGICGLRFHQCPVCDVPWPGNKSVFASVSVAPIPRTRGLHLRRAAARSAAGAPDALGGGSGQK